MTLRLLARRKAALLGAAVLGLMVVLAVAGPAIIRTDPLKMNPVLALTPPNAEHPFGTDQYGRDVLTRVIAGARLSLVTGLGAVVIALAGGLGLGLVSALGYVLVNLLVDVSYSLIDPRIRHREGAA